MNSRLVYYSIVVGTAGFLFGFDTIVINGAEQELQGLWKGFTLFGSNDAFHGWIVVASALWGTVIGALFGGIPNDKLGRKKTLILIGVLYSISALGSAMVSGPWAFAFFRFVGGLGVGASTIAAPAFVSEVAPADQRGKLTALYQLNIVIGILIAFVSNYLISNLVSVESWRWMIGIEALPAIIYTLLVTRIPESPRWLIVKRNDTEGARKVFEQLMPKELVQQQIEAIQSHHATNALKGEILFSKKYRFPVFLAFSISFFNQFSGINALLYYARRIFEAAGLGAEAGLLSSVGLGVANLIFTLLGVFLIDRLGRRQLMYIGSVGYITTLGVTGLSFLYGWTAIVPAALFLFIGAHAIGQGAIIWVFISEIFPNHIRSAGQSFGTSVHWWLAAIIPAMMPFLMNPEVLGPAMVFFIFAFFMIFQLLFVAFIMPETKGLTLEELEDRIIGK
jgi:SP family arabinose:H+ symporter-like MFS transporter